MNVFMFVVCVSLPLQLLFYTQSMLIMGPVYDATHDASKAYNVRWRVPSSSTRRLALASRLLMSSLMLSLLLALLSLMLMPSVLFGMVPICTAGWGHVLLLGRSHAACQRTLRVDPLELPAKVRRVHSGTLSCPVRGCLTIGAGCTMCPPCVA